MNNSTIVKSLIGLTLAGGATAGIVFATLPSQPQKPTRTRTRAEILAEREVKKGESFKVLANLFNKHKSDDNTKSKKLAEIIDGKESSYVIFALKDESSFIDSGPVETSLTTWCLNNKWVPAKETKEYETDLSKDKEAICAFSKIMADKED